MPEAPRDGLKRGDARRNTHRDLQRLQRRGSDTSFWQSMSVIGAGWPIALFGLGGGTLGRYLDTRWHTGVRLTFTLLAVGVVLGSWASWRTLKGKGP